MIDIDRLEKHYGGLRAVDGLSLRVVAGEVYALLGPNGAGKTSALRCVAGLIGPTAGRVTIAGHDVARDRSSALKALGYLPSATGVYERLTAQEALQFAGRLHGLRGERLDEMVRRATVAFGLQRFLRQRCGTLSTGERRRMALARSLVHDPPAIVLDEPTLGLDVVAATAVYTFIRKAKEAGKAILLSTHRMEEVQLLADRVGILNQGRLAVEGTPERIIEDLGVTDLTAAFLQVVGVGT